MVSLQPCRGKSGHGPCLPCSAASCDELRGNGCTTQGCAGNIFRKITHELYPECRGDTRPREKGCSIGNPRFFDESTMGLIHVCVFTRSRFSSAGGSVMGAQGYEREPKTISDRGFGRPFQSAESAGPERR